MTKEKIQIPFDKKVVTLILSDFDADIDTDDITSIDYSNIIGELLTFPVVMNRIGLIRAEIHNVLSEKKLNVQIMNASLTKKYRNELRRNDGEKVKEATEKAIESSVTLDQGYQIALRNEVAAERNYNIVDALYWALKDKSGKLDALSHRITPQEFENEIIEGTVNGIMVKCSKSLIPKV